MAGQPAGTSLKRRLKELRNIPQLRVILELPRGEAASGVYVGAAQLCYHVLGLVHAMWTPVPGAIKDFIATPKSNGYKVCGICCGTALCKRLTLSSRLLTQGLGERKLWNPSWAPTMP